MILDNGAPWEPEDFQLEVVADLFGTAPEVWMVVPEGNGKTTLMSGAGLYFCDYTPAANVLLAAAAQEQCRWMFDQAGGMVYRTPAMKRRFRVYEGYLKIQSLRPEAGGQIKVFSADSRTGDGAIPGGIVLLDELHRHRDMRLYRTWRGKLGKRGAKLCAISTAGEPETEFETIREQLKAEAPDVVVNGSHTRAATPEMVLHDWSIPSTESVEDMEAVKAANPFSGITVEALARKRASHTMSLAHWQRFVCNQATRSEASAITAAEWAALRKPGGIPAGEPVWVGLDIAWKWDTTAAVPLWLPEPHRRVLGDPKILTPPRDGTSLSPDAVQDALLEIHERTPVHTVVMDENAGGAQLADWIESELGARVVAHSQGHTAMALAYERWMEALRNDWLEHSGDLEFARHVLNAIARVLPGGQTRFDRPVGARNAGSDQQERRVWDALTAASMVHSVAVANDEPERTGLGGLSMDDLDSFRITAL